jgi:hypothetical protein
VSVGRYFVIGYFFFGGLRNLLGIGLLTCLVFWGIPLSIALFFVVLMDFFFYIAQVRYFIGRVDVVTIGQTFVFIYFANRLILWALFEQLGFRIYFAQFISIILLTSISFSFLKSRRKDQDSAQGSKCQ